MKLFQYAIIWTPSEAQKKESLKAKIIVDLKTVLAANLDQANILASRDIPEEFLTQLDQVEISCRPF